MDKKIHIVKVLALLIFSCSLLQPLSTSDALQNSVERDKSANLVRSVSSYGTLSCVVTTGYENGLVNLRAGAGTTFAVLLVLPEHARLEVLERSGWHKVRTEDGLTGYISARYCSIGE